MKFSQLVDSQSVGQIITINRGGSWKKHAWIISFHNTQKYMPMWSTRQDSIYRYYGTVYTSLIRILRIVLWSVTMHMTKVNYTYLLSSIDTSLNGRPLANMVCTNSLQHEWQTKLKDRLEPLPARTHSRMKVTAPRLNSRCVSVTKKAPIVFGLSRNHIEELVLHQYIPTLFEKRGLAWKHTG